MEAMPSILDTSAIYVNTQGMHTKKVYILQDQYYLIV